MVTRVKIDKELESIVPSFLENRRKDIDILTNSLRDSDYESIETIGHRLSGNAGGYGFDELGTIGKKLELAAQNKDDNKITELTKAIEDYVEDLEIIYE